MSLEDVEQHLDAALEHAAATDTDLDDVAAALETRLERVDQMRIARGEAAPNHQ